MLMKREYINEQDDDDRREHQFDIQVHHEVVVGHTVFARAQWHVCVEFWRGQQQARFGDSAAHL